MSVVVNIFAIFGLIIIIAILIHYLYKYINNKKKAAISASINPPGEYMQNTGIKCPDYWVNIGIDSNGNYICKNSYNIQTNNPKTGPFANKCDSTQTIFSPIKSGYTWDYGNPNGLTSYGDSDKFDFLSTSSNNGSMTRCDWINNCGPSPNTQGIWSGVNEICNNPPIDPIKK
jgi:hypothetical protein